MRRSSQVFKWQERERIVNRSQRCSPLTGWITPGLFMIYTVCLQTNGAVSKVNKKFISHLTRAQRTPSAAATVQVSHALPAVRSLVLIAGLRGQFTRWRRSRKRLSVCFVLRCPDLCLQCSVSFLHGLEKTHHARNSEGRRAEDVFALKIRRLRPGLNPRTWVPKTSTLPLDHRSRFLRCIKLKRMSRET